MGERLPQLVNLLGLSDAEGVQVAAASDLELGNTVLVLLDLTAAQRVSGGKQ